MIATFCIEIGLLGYSWWRYQGGARRNLVVGLLLSLAIFQIAEYFVCGGLGISALIWSRVGFVAITLLPPLCLTLVGELGGKRPKLPSMLAWGAAGALIAFLTFAPQAVNAALCAGNYVIFHLSGPGDWSYGLYYYAVLMGIIMLATSRMEAAKDPKTKAALRWIVAGILSFLGPTATVNAVDLKTINGIPSIMCGFAIVFAIILALRVLPLTTSLKTRRSET